MAIWQFGFYLVPRVGIIRIHGHVPSVLEEFKPINPNDYEFDEDKKFENYWQDISVPSSVKETISSLLSPMQSWSEEAEMFGNNDGSKVEIWNDDFLIQIDARKFDHELLNASLKIAKQLDCLLALRENGKIIEPDLKVIIDEFKVSKACKFVIDPIETIKKFGIALDK